MKNIAHTNNSAAGSQVAPATAVSSHQASHTPLKQAPQGIMPDLIAKRLALSESGFVFDPVTGQSFSVNETGVAVLRMAQNGGDMARLMDELATQFDAAAEEIRRDVLDFAERLKDCFK